LHPGNKDRSDTFSVLIIKTAKDVTKSDDTISKQCISPGLLFVWKVSLFDEKHTQYFDSAAMPSMLLEDSDCSLLYTASPFT